jgi:hypothetical protein
LGYIKEQWPNVAAYSTIGFALFSSTPHIAQIIECIEEITLSCLRYIQGSKPKMPLSNPVLLIRVLLHRAVSASTPSKLHIPSDTVNFVYHSNARGTSDIVFSCLFTTLVCPRAIQRLNIPVQGPESINWRQALKKSIKRFRSNAIWMLVTMLSPELLLGLAFQDFMRGRRSIR